MSGIYRIVCVPTGKIYVGSGADIRKRWRQHQVKLRSGKHENGHLQNAWKKYGEEAFLFEMVEEVGIECLLDVEQKHLDALSPVLRFNICPTAGNRRGVKERPETCAKQAARMIGNSYALGNVLTPETRARMSAAHIGRPRSPEVCARLRVLKLGNKNWLGKKHSPEAKVRMSLARKAYWEMKRAG